MTVSLAEDGAIVLQGACSSADAETLLQHLLINPAAEVDWRGCEHAHTAVVQVLLTARPVVRGPPRSTFLVERLEHILSLTGI